MPHSLGALCPDRDAAGDALDLLVRAERLARISELVKDDLRQVLLRKVYPFLLVKAGHVFQLLCLDRGRLATTRGRPCC